MDRNVPNESWYEKDKRKALRNTRVLLIQPWMLIALMTPEIVLPG